MNSKRDFFLNIVLLLLFLGMFLGGASAMAASFSVAGDSVHFRYPMRIGPELSGSFAELRRNHFHGGLDMRTRQREGIKVYSAAPGMIVRASVSKVSYGKALYVQHANGMVTLYAHLQKFCAPVQRMIRRQQRKSGQYETNLINLNIKTKQKKPIARSGNTGSSGGPHLHFEILKDSLRLNPSLYGINIADSVPPALLYMAFYSHISADFTENIVLPDVDSLLQHSFMDAPALDYLMATTLQHEYDSLQTLVNQRNDTLCANRPPLFSLTKTIDSLVFYAHYFRADSLPDTLYLHKYAAFGVCALDSIQRMPFHYGLYRLLFAIENAQTATVDTLACYQLDKLSLNTCANLNQHIDLPFYEKTGRRLEKSYLEDGQIFTPYHIIQNRGVFIPRKNQSYFLHIQMEDVCGNRTEKRIPMVGK